MSGKVGESDKWVRRFHPAPDAETQLVCLPHAGGSASFFFSASRALSPDVDVLAVQYPGRLDRRTEAFVDRIDALAGHVADALMPFTERPLALFGHSMGALLGFEVVRLLEARGVQPIALVVSGRRGPDTYRDEAHHLSSDAELIAEVASLSGTSSAVLDNAEIVRMALPAIRNDYRAVETYRFPGGPLVSAPIYAHVGESDPKATLDEVRAWARHTTGTFEFHTHPGGHFYLSAPESTVVPFLARLMSSVSRSR
ncbi:thioesterase II family protein [Streptomyces sp. NPDC050658]|uniref:thioesterase II family protein n=1 Tax=unclassified Streptomyces TaxID=2593676 RepID=UPI003419D703